MTTMEDLTKTQIVLLTLLVSFITSIATGIITVSLLAEAPQGVTQTIDRVVERTVESVSPDAGGSPVREVTVVKEDDAILASIASTAKAVVRIKYPADAAGAQSFYSLGVVVSKQGYVLADKRNIAGGTYTVVFSDGSTLPADLVRTSETGALALFKLQADSSRLASLAPITLSKSDPKLGQTVIAIEGAERDAVAVGRVISLDRATGTALTDIPAVNETSGGPLLNLSGELVGLKSSNADLTLPAGSYTVVSPIAKFIGGNQ